MGVALCTAFLEFRVAPPYTSPPVPSTAALGILDLQHPPSAFLLSLQPSSPSSPNRRLTGWVCKPSLCGVISLRCVLFPRVAPAGLHTFLSCLTRLFPTRVSRDHLELRPLPQLLRIQALAEHTKSPGRTTGCQPFLALCLPMPGAPNEAMSEGRSVPGHRPLFFRLGLEGSQCIPPAPTNWDDHWAEVEWTSYVRY